jgi:hypothetical protein
MLRLELEHYKFNNDAGELDISQKDVSVPLRFFLTPQERSTC